MVGPTAGLVAAGLTAAGLTAAGLTAADDAGGSWESVAGDAVDELVALRRRHRDLAVVLDDAEALVGGPAEPVLREICRLVDEDDGFVVAATSASVMPTGPGTLLADLARSRTGVLLCPGSAEGDLLGVRITRQAKRKFLHRLAIELRLCGVEFGRRERQKMGLIQPSVLYLIYWGYWLL